MKLISSSGLLLMIVSVLATGSALWIDANDVRGFDSITITIDTLSADALSIDEATLSSGKMQSQR